MGNQGMPVSPELNEILCAFPNYVLLIDEKHRIIYANAAVTTDLGCTAEQLTGSLCANTLHGVDKPVDSCPLEECVRTRAAVERETFDQKSQRWLSAAAYPTSLKTTEGLGIYLHVIQDITQRKTAEQELSKSLAKMGKLTDAGINAITLIVEKRDPYTAGHQQRVSQLAGQIAASMGLGHRTVDCIKKVGLLHDVGKIAIPIEILSKPGRISDDEFRMIKYHPQVGYDILKDIDIGVPIADIILQHHERLDGSGYPKGLKRDEISLEAKIISVSDVIEAMISHRPYRPSLGIDFTINELIKNRGTHYDPDIVDVCAQLFSDDKYEF